ncbi:demethylmenaquinone methyltransferase/2-methoxy-6-polyprenyl-1,4-benzoquinol methylase [Halanaerobium saccharolyticum]|uniref:Demethylmenaquinone methyltransferase/2-methoxy-6-polyprenyl-1,4-benzoquinol methylase n=1 Tax=Halanaerobium saccharolyticum TaxID=43595 RepID=A0A4V3G530_9FIRM|nr:methyltransferase domain-containing protein [Halanaerobium saccharolyticum]RAK07486.1 demethylmenaquinone methyltransferase/2-methoxy-6-polyprenyl-1,4-benzoquinol methylase [Halanaerobium saccharolyticum]TDW03063.1 demethylmenaquinone methyltransferase/2-methoxy-6-polyprenyl-1,4-benzoquinol methylase [Halanaerobium saccharolyticum]TDX59359.1 demethylmenaquinone methyltransferase/2-methoxy-6-polyprenyl-1,4-benzoquinol methylase [Halanaerobium saccharolyticum]
MDLFTLAAPVFDLAMKISGHNQVLVELGNRIKKDELKRHSNGNRNSFNLNQTKFKTEQKSEKKKSSIKLLDLGGGTGELANHLPKNLKVTVADPSQAMLAKGRKKEFSQEVKFELADGADLPFAAETFDYLTISDALHHFRQVETALNEAARVLKPGGKLYILEFDPTTLFTKTIIFFEKIAGEPVNFYQPQKMAEMMAESGLKTEAEYLNKSLYIITAKKAAG